MSEINLLISVPKVRELKEFDDAVDNYLQDFDKVFVNYYPSFEARHLIKDYFLDHEEYTHLAILPDDMIPNRVAINLLMNDLSKNDYPVLCGRSHLNNTEEGRKIVTVSLTLASPVMKEGMHYYNFLQEDSELFMKLLEEKQPIIVKHMGDPFPIIRRDVVKLLTFNNDSQYNSQLEQDGCCEDIVMCVELDKLQIPIHCDLRAWFKHLKISDEENKKNLLIDKEIANIQYVKGKRLF